MPRAPATLRFVLFPALVALSGCGDDGKRAPRDAPAAPPTTAPPIAPETSMSVPPPPPIPSATTSADDVASWGTTRAGDWATWEVKVVGSDSVTKLTWRALSTGDEGVRYSVEARTLDVAGETKSLVKSDEMRTWVASVPGRVPSWRAQGETRGTSVIAGRTLSTVSRVRDDAGPRTTVVVSAEVPFSGLVKSTSADVEQSLVAFGRGP